MTNKSGASFIGENESRLSRTIPRGETWIPKISYAGVEQDLWITDRGAEGGRIRISSSLENFSAAIISGRGLEMTQTVIGEDSFATTTQIIAGGEAVVELTPKWQALSPVVVKVSHTIDNI